MVNEDISVDYSRIIFLHQKYILHFNSDSSDDIQVLQWVEVINSGTQHKTCKQSLKSLGDDNATVYMKTTFIWYSAHNLRSKITKTELKRFYILSHLENNL